jgi:iron-sulfur cluster repair protein YtfE (RIC family)
MSTASTPFGYFRKDTAMTHRLNVIEMLERDHRLIDQLAEQLDDADDPSEMRRLFLRIVEELSAHEAAEQEVLFPAFRSMVDASSDHTLDHRMGEHEELNELLAEMRTLPPDGFAFVKRGSALLLEIKGHFQVEEETVFERMRAALTADQLAELGGRAVIAKQHCPAFPHDHPKVAG